MKEYQFHEYADIFPLMDKEDSESLKKSIQNKYLKQYPILLYEDKILDGRNRYNLCKELNIEPNFSKFEGIKQEAIDFVWSSNFGRRHLTSFQKLEAYDKKAEKIKMSSELKIIENQIIERNKKGQIQSKKPTKGSEPFKGINKIKDQIKPTREAIADELNISTKTVDIYNKAKKLQDKHPEIKKKFEDAKKGKTTIKNVDKEIRRIENTQKTEIVKEKAKENKVLLGKILDGDFFDKINEIENNSIDLLFADPPYMILKDKWDSFKDLYNFMNFTKSWLDLVIPKLKQSARIYICFSQWYKYDLYNLLKENKFYGFNFAQEIIWHYKNNNKPSNRKEYRYAYEPILYLYGNDAKELNFTADTYGEIQTNVWEIASPQSNFKEGKFTNAQKPLELLKRIIMTGSKENDIILDPFAGSGTTGIVCEELNRKYILIEKDIELVKIIKGRLNNVERKTI